MRSLLKVLKEQSILCEIYDIEDKLENFNVGYIVDFDEENFIFESVSSDGRHDGFHCLEIDTIAIIEYKTNYLQKIQKLMTANNFTRIPEIARRKANRRIFELCKIAQPYLLHRTFERQRLLFVRLFNLVGRRFVQYKRN